MTEYKILKITCIYGKNYSYIRGMNVFTKYKKSINTEYEGDKLHVYEYFKGLESYLDINEYGDKILTEYILVKNINKDSNANIPFIDISVLPTYKKIL